MENNRRRLNDVFFRQPNLSSCNQQARVFRLFDIHVLKDEVSTAIDKMENIDYKNVLYLRYIEGLTWEDIGAKIYASERTARRYHNAALKEFVP